MESAQHVLEKWVWSEGDFARMNWRDSGIHATAIVREESQPRLGLSLLFDIDYIVQPADLSRTQRTQRPLLLKTSRTSNSICVLISGCSGSPRSSDSKKRMRRTKARQYRYGSSRV
jgi:hypothetical protein